jgi:hypothetical protein
VSWLRLEGATRDPELVEGLAACVADPLWKLARQWQVGEFHGEDAASAIVVTAEVSVMPITAFAPGGAAEGDEVLARSDADRPLEVLVEQEPATDDVRLSLDLGWVLLRALFGTGVGPDELAALREAYRQPLPADDGLDPDGRAELELLARRSVDGRRIAADLAAEPGRFELLSLLGAAGEGGRRIRRVVTDWFETAGEHVRSPSVDPSWRTGPLEYQFRVGAPERGGEVTLAATEYRGGTLDWYHFDHVPNAEPLEAAGEHPTRTITVLPTPLRFHGMPAARFWAIEEETVSFGDLVGGPEDLVRAIVGGFAAVYHNDWMVVPCHMPAGSVGRVKSLTVHDDYGTRQDIPAAAVLDGPARVWRFFELDDVAAPGPPIRQERPVAPLLLMAPALPDTEEGPPVERVDMIRDEVANLAWAIERRAMAASGRTVDRDAASTPAEAVDHGDSWYYQAYTPVPENWIPFVPVQNESGDLAEIHLRRGRVAVPPPGVPPERLLPMGRILDARSPLRIHEAAIPDAGLRVDRRYQRARGADGRIHMWLGRRVRMGAWPATGRFAADRLRRDAPETG